MSDLEPNALSIVGCDRDSVLHISRADSSRQVVTLLHSEACLSHFEDLRECPFSEALDQGISLKDWGEYRDRPIVSEIDPNGTLVPFPLGSIRAGAFSPGCRAAKVQQALNEKAFS